MKNIQLLIKFSIFSLLFILLSGCRQSDVIIEKDATQKLTIFFINDQHSRLDNFAKIKHIVDQEREKTNVLLVCAGDIFSGNPIVDQYSQKGYPIIDVMNKTGFNISVLGNHEFDYGVPVLKDRMEQANFDWVCANVSTLSSGFPQPAPYQTLIIDDIKITVLGLIETNGKPDAVIPSTHPWRVADLAFQRFYDVADQYQDLKDQENADIYLALTHLGSGSDNWLAENFPFFDIIIGGHSHELINANVNKTLILQAGSYLSHLGKAELTIQNREIVQSNVNLIDLSTYSEVDNELMQVIETYNNAPEFYEVVGHATSDLDRTELGCFYTTALKEYMNVDASFQNSGGIRVDISQGDITAFDIYSMDPFNNGSVVFTMSVAEIKNFFMTSGTGLHVSGISFEKTDTGLIIYDENGIELSEDTNLTIGLNDYIPAVYDSYFTYSEADIKELTTAETIIQYLKTNNSTVDYEGCDQYFYY